MSFHRAEPLSVDNNCIWHLLPSILQTFTPLETISRGWVDSGGWTKLEVVVILIEVEGIIGDK